MFSAGVAFGTWRRLAVTLLVSVFATAAMAEAPPRAPGGGTSAFTTELVKPGLHRISGAGGSTLLLVASKGLILVDSQREGTYRPLMDEVHRIAKTNALPVRGLLLTAVGPDQAGNVAQFAAAGVPVIVQQRALPLLVADARARGAAAPASIVTYRNDYVLREGDLDAEAEHVGRGRTGADSVVYFRELRTVAVGELFTHDAPQPDCASGGSFAGWAAAITHLLWFDFDVAIPSRGAPVGKRELVALKAKLEALAERGTASSPGPSDCQPLR